MSSIFLDSSQLLPAAVVFHLTRTYWNFWTFVFKDKHSFLKTNYSPASGYQFFWFFLIFLSFFKVEAAFPYSGNIFSQYPSPGSSKWIFCIVKTVFFGQCYFTASRNHYWNKEKTVLRETAHSCWWNTDFPASRKYIYIFSIFRRPLSVFFRLVEKYFSRISLLAYI